MIQYDAGYERQIGRDNNSDGFKAVVPIRKTMCGIWVCVGDCDVRMSPRQYEALQKRGPDDTKILSLADAIMAFHRLAIRDPRPEGMQPFVRGDCVLVCNGEIYNYDELLERFPALRSDLVSHSDCEIILALYLYLGRSMEAVLDHIRGEFSLVLLEMEADTETLRHGYAARDPYGVRPLFIGTGKDRLVLSSLLQGLVGLVQPSTARQLEPGHLLCFGKDGETRWQRQYHAPRIFVLSSRDERSCYREVCDRLIEAVRRRMISDRPIGALLSGGLDSSLVVAIVHRILGIPVRTFTIGLDGCESTDIGFAQDVVEHLGLGSAATIVRLPMEDALGSIEEVIKDIESYDITTIRASIMQHAIARYIRTHTSIRVILNGDGADEVQMGYLYFRLAPDTEAARQENHKLLREIHFFDGLRVDRCLGAMGLEARLPFLDVEFVEYFMSLPAEWTVPIHGRAEKALIRNAFHVCYPGLLPDSVLFRQKEAFSDGVSSSGHSWHRRLQSHINKMDFHLDPSRWKINPPISKESMYYRSLFDQHFQGMHHVLPHFWQPAFTTAQDPSARELSTVYHGSRIIDR